MTDAGNPGFRIILTTCAEQEEAERIAQTLVELQLAACVNILPGARSVYRWEGRIESSSEVLLLIKTSSRHVTSVQESIAGRHSYAVPEFLVLEISAGSGPYLEWLAGSLK